MEKDKYEKAYKYMLQYWKSFSKEQKQQINKDLNKIFGKEHKEYLKVV